MSPGGKFPSKERLWGHDGIRIEIPYAIARILAEQDHPHRDELLASISASITEMIAASSLLEQSPIVTIIEGIMIDGNDMSMGPVAYLRKVFMDDVVRSYATLKMELGL